MNLKKILLSSVAAVALTGVSAMAAETTAVSIAQDQTGDYLVFPAYYANSSGWSTNIKVVNTNTTHAAVAKVVIREHKKSTEKLDFPIYLTPGDVWEATLKYVDGKVYISSTDDSMFTNGAPASDVNPVNQVLFDNGTDEDYTKGYVEVFGIGMVAGNYSGLTLASGETAWSLNNPMGKKTLYNYYNSTLKAGTTTGWSAVGINDIYGQEVISASNSNGNLAMTLMATAFEGVTGPVAISGDLIATESSITNLTTSIRGATTIRNEIEAELQKSNVYVTYYEASSGAAETALLLTQPMKKYRVNTDLPAIGYTAAATVTSSLSYSFKYTPIARNQTENALISTTDYSGGTPTTYTCNTEICQLSVNGFVGSYSKGYVDFSLDQGTSTSYHSMPVIPAVMTAKNVGGANITNIIYPAYK